MKKETAATAERLYHLLSQELGEKFNPGTKITDEIIEASNFIENALFSKDRLKSDYFEKRLGLNGGQIRRAIAYLRDNGVLIGSDNGGYYFIRSADDFRATYNHLLCRSTAILHRARNLEKSWAKENQRELWKK